MAKVDGAEPGSARTPEELPAFQVVVPATRAHAVVGVVRQLIEHELHHSTIVVDDTADGRVTAALAGLPVRVVRSAAASAGGARNVGVEATTASWVLFIDDDVVLPAGFGATVRRHVALASDDVAIFGSSVVPVGDVSRPYWRCRLVGAPPPGFVISACLLVRRAAYLGVGGCAPANMCEDVDLWLRIVGRGHRDLVTGELSVLHPVERLSLARFLRLARWYRDDAWFIRRHRGWLGRHAGRRVGPLSVWTLSRHLPLLGVAVAVPMALAARSPWAAAAGPLTVGFGLHLKHLRDLRRFGYRVPATAALDPIEIAVHAARSVLQACYRVAGEIDCLRHPEKWRPAMRSGR